MSTKLFHTKGIWKYLSTRPEIDAVKIDFTSITFYSKGKAVLNVLDDTTIKIPKPLEEDTL